MERHEERALARRALESLAERERVAIIMRADGFDYDEIAEELKLPRGFVGTTLSRARRRISEQFEMGQRQIETQANVTS